MTFLRHALAQLIGSERKDLGLLQFTVQLAELLRQLLALAGDVGALGRRILRGRGAELLHALLQLANARFELLDLAAKCFGRRIEGLSKTHQRFRQDIFAVDAGFDLVQGGLDRLERGRLAGLFPRGSIDDHRRDEQCGRNGQTKRLPSQGKPSAPDRHGTVSLLVRECQRERWPIWLPCALRESPGGQAPSALIPSRPASKTLTG